MSTSRQASIGNANGTTVSPTRFAIGVTGARILADEPLLGAQTGAVLADIRDQIERRSVAPVRYVILSPLAEGADRLVALKGLEVLDADLEVVLPFEESEYVADFEAPESKAEFNELYARARRVTHVEPAANRVEAYETAGRYVVDHCDVLIALWDGKPASGRGGTAEIVKYARQRGRPLYWIHTEDGHIVEELGEGLDMRTKHTDER